MVLLLNKHSFSCIEYNQVPWRSMVSLNKITNKAIGILMTSETIVSLLRTKLKRSVLVKIWMACIYLRVSWYGFSMRANTDRVWINVNLYIYTLQWRRYKRLKSPASPLFARPFVQAQIKENIKAPCH